MIFGLTTKHFGVKTSLEKQEKVMSKLNKDFKYLSIALILINMAGIPILAAAILYLSDHGQSIIIPCTGLD